MNKILLSFKFVLIMTCVFIFTKTDAQVIEDFKTSTSAQIGKKFPQVNSERRVRVQISAPEAKLVELDIGAVKYDLKKD